MSARSIQDNLVALGLLTPTKQTSEPKWPTPHSRTGTEENERNIAAAHSPNSSYSTPRPVHTLDSRASPWLSRRPSANRNQPVPLQQPSSSNRRDVVGMIEIDRAYTRRDRTFAGSRCVICEEPSEHTLRNERILQLSCSHLSHEACFYEFIRDFSAQRCPGCDATLGLDSGRGGNVLDIEKLSNIVRSLQYPPQAPLGDPRATPISWDHVDNTRRAFVPELLEFQRQQAELMQAQSHLHARNESNGTSRTAIGPGGPSIISARRHTHNGNPVETLTASPRSSAVKNPILPPTVYVRSEYPTLTRSRQQQSLTCLISVAVPEGKWRPDAGDLQIVQPAQPQEIEPNQAPVPTSPREKAEVDPQHTPEALAQITEDLHSRVDNWHGLDFSRFGPLRLHSKLQVGKDRQSWQELECYLFSEMLICIKDKKTVDQVIWETEPGSNVRPKATLKGSIMIKKHLNQVEASSGDEPLLTLKLSVPELPSFHLHFPTNKQLEIWEQALTNINAPPEDVQNIDTSPDTAESEIEQYHSTTNAIATSRNSARNAGKATATTTTESVGANHTADNNAPTVQSPLHPPVDIVVVIPMSSSMHGIKLTLLHDALIFLVENLGPRDRIGLVAFGPTVGVSQITEMSNKFWPGWSKVFESMRTISQKSTRGDVVDGTNVAVDMLMQRKSINPISSILVIGDSSTSESESIDFVISRAEAAKISVYSFGLGLTHKPDAMIELSTRTEGSYTYVKDWMMLRECVAGCLGSLQTTSHLSVKLKLRLPEGSPAKFAKISGALHVTKRASGRDAEVSLGDLRFGDKRDVLVQLTVSPENYTVEPSAQDPWESIVSGLEALGGPLEQDDQRTTSVEEVPIIQAGLTYGDVLRNGAVSQSQRPSLLAITMLAAPNKSKSSGRPMSLPIPPHPLIVQRRMELLTSDMLTRALTLVARGQNERAQHLLRETRSILKGLGKGGLPPLPPSRAPSRVQSPSSSAPVLSGSSEAEGPEKQPSSPATTQVMTSASGVDPDAMSALDAELESALEWVNHPAVFARDSRKAVLQAIGAISSQRAYTFRSPLESIWANRVRGIRELAVLSREWQRGDEDDAADES